RAEEGWAVMWPVRPGIDPVLSLIASPRWEKEKSETPLTSDDRAEQEDVQQAARLIAQLFPSNDAEKLSQYDIQDASRLAERIKQWKEEYSGQRLLLTIDQAEELVTMTRTPKERDHFLQLLRRAIEAEPDLLRVVLTVRSDFEPQIRRAFEGDTEDRPDS